MFPLCDFLAANFASRGPAKNCWVWSMIDDPAKCSWDEVIQILQRHGADRDFARRLLHEHPDRSHIQQHDDRLLDAFTEAEAFCWATEVAGLPAPEFVFEQGCPDLRMGDIWIEAKTVHESDEEAKILDRIVERSGGGRRMIPQGALPRQFWRKLDSQVADATRKWRRQKSGILITFFDVRTVDGPYMRSDRRLKPQFTAWARAAIRTHGVGVVVTHNHRWREPWFQ